MTRSDTTDDDSTLSLTTVLAFVAVVVGLLVLLPATAGGYEAARIEAQPDTTYDLDPSLTNGHRFEDLSPDAQRLVEEALRRDGQVTVSRSELPKVFRETGDRVGEPDDEPDTHVLRRDRVYGVDLRQAENESAAVTVEFERINGVVYDYETLSERGRTVVDRTAAAPGRETRLYGAAPPEFEPAALWSEVGDGLYYVRYDGRYQTLRVTDRVELFDLGGIYVLAVLLGSVLTAIGTMTLLAPRLGDGIAVTAGFGLVAVPLLIIRSPYLLTPVGSPAATVVGATLVAALVAGGVVVGRAALGGRP